MCSTLIGLFRSEDWDTHRDSLDRYADDPAIVQAFREHEIYVTECGAWGADGYRECELEAGHAGDHDDRRGWTWPREETHD